MTEQDFEPPRAARYFEDYPPGLVARYGSIRVERDEIVEYAKRYDPQPMHVDPVAAANGPYGDLIASGWLTMALTMRLFVERYLSSVAALVSPGVDELRWLEPVRPGDTLSIRVSVLEAIRSQSRPDRGMVRSRLETINQNDKVVMTGDAMNLFRCRTAAPVVHRRPPGFV